jgi:hypothetical protein
MRLCLTERLDGKRLLAIKPKVAAAFYPQGGTFGKQLYFHRTAARAREVINHD